MKPCNQVLEKMVAGEPYSADDKAHLEACAACQHVERTHAAWMQSAALWGDAGAAPAADVQKLRQDLEQRLAKPDRSFQYAQLATALAVVLFLLGLCWAPKNASDPDLDRVDRHLISMMEDVSSVVRPQKSSSVLSEGNASATGWIGEEDQNESEDDEILPETYSLLQESLENEWL